MHCHLLFSQAVDEEQHRRVILDQDIAVITALLERCCSSTDGTFFLTHGTIDFQFIRPSGNPISRQGCEGAHPTFAPHARAMLRWGRWR